MIMTDVMKVLKAGEVLKDPAKWKKGQLLTNAVVGVVSGGLGLLKWQLPDIEIPPEAEELLVNILMSALIGVNLFVTAASSDKISITGKEK